MSVTLICLFGPAPRFLLQVVNSGRLGLLASPSHTVRPFLLLSISSCCGHVIFGPWIWGGREWNGLIDASVRERFNSHMASEVIRRSISMSKDVSPITGKVLWHSTLVASVMVTESWSGDRKHSATGTSIAVMLTSQTTLVISPFLPDGSS